MSLGPSSHAHQKIQQVIKVLIRSFYQNSSLKLNKKRENWNTHTHTHTCTHAHNSHLARFLPCRQDAWVRSQGVGVAAGTFVIRSNTHWEVLLFTPCWALDPSESGSPSAEGRSVTSLWLCGPQQTVENSERDGNTRPPDLPLEKPVCKSGSNS